MSCLCGAIDCPSCGPPQGWPVGIERNIWHKHYCQCCTQYYDCDDIGCELPYDAGCTACIAHENICYSQLGETSMGQKQQFSNTCRVCGGDHGDMSHAVACGQIKIIRIDCPECQEQNCTALLLVINGDPKGHVSWCENGHVTVGNEDASSTVCKFF